jgi:hypothetical protein
MISFQKFIVTDVVERVIHFCILRSSELIERSILLQILEDVNKKDPKQRFFQLLPGILQSKLYQRRCSFLFFNEC